MRRNRRPAMSDRERILMHSINLLAMDAACGQPIYRRDDSFLRWEETPGPGDLVLCATGIGPWKISWMVANLGNGDALLREVGGPGLCSYSNERYQKIDYGRTIYASQFLEGAEYQLACKIESAVRRLDCYLHRILHINFDGPLSWGCRRPCTVVFRGHIWAQSDSTYEIPIVWGSKTTIKDLVKQLEDGGYGDDSKLLPRQRNSEVG